jgi:hypothetical protein
MKNMLLLLLAIVFTNPIHAQEKEYIELQFYMDEDDLLQQLLFQDRISRDSEKQVQAIQNFRAFMWSRYEKELLTFRYGDPQNSRYKWCLSKIKEEAKKCPDYAELFAQTQERLEYCKNQWETNYQQSFAIMKEITRLHFHRTFRVYIGHPAVPEGRYRRNMTICWGGREYGKNYTTVYLWHEIMHSYCPHGLVGHSLQELAADNELRQRLNGPEDHSWGTNENVGHPEQDSFRLFMRNDWKRYREASNIDILDLARAIKKRYGIVEQTQ